MTMGAEHSLVCAVVNSSDVEEIARPFTRRVRSGHASRVRCETGKKYLVTKSAAVRRSTFAGSSANASKRYDGRIVGSVFWVSRRAMVALNSVAFPIAT
jgi:hypothetical protein